VKSRSAALTFIAVLGSLACIAVLGGISRARAAPAYVSAKPDAAIKAFGPEIAAKIFSDDFTPLRHEAVLRSTQTIPGFECPGDPQITLADVVPYPVKPGAVSWIESYVVACAPRAKRNFLLLLDGERGRIAELLPGGTITDPTLQHDASHGAKLLAKSLRPETCGRTILVDTRVTAPPEGTAAPWIERWTFDQCAVATDVEMTFTPSAKGGAMWSGTLVK
jgi:hypothetical protein